MARNTKNKARPARGLGAREQHFLHVKEFSQGKPNELSLNVLEQKAAAQDARPSRWQRLMARVRSDHAQQAALHEGPAGEASQEAGEAKAGPAPASPSRGLFKRRRAKRVRTSAHAAPAGQKGGPSASGFMGSDSQAEIEQRQRRRRRYRRVSLAVVGVACAGLLCAGGWWAYQEYQRLSTSVGVLREACALMSEADEVTVALDEYFQAEFDDDTAEDAQSLAAQLPAARETLEEARLYAHKAQGELKGSQRDQEAAEDALNSIAARETMFDTAEVRLEADQMAKPALDAMDEAQRCIQEGNSLLQQAARVVSDTTTENVEDSTRYTAEAQASFASARTALDQAQALYPAADLSTYYAYLDKRTEATVEALASNAAILLQDRATAESHNDAYNAADAAAVELAQNMPSEFAQPIIDEYSAQTDEAYESYEAARHDAAVSDSHLREYLG